MKEMLRKVFVCPVDRQSLLQGEAWLVQATEGCPLQGGEQAEAAPREPWGGGLLQGSRGQGRTAVVKQVCALHLYAQSSVLGDRVRTAAQTTLALLPGSSQSRVEKKWV